MNMCCAHIYIVCVLFKTITRFTFPLFTVFTGTFFAEQSTKKYKKNRIIFHIETPLFHKYLNALSTKQGSTTRYHAPDHCC